MEGNLSILDLFLQASFLVKGVMLILLMMSIASWCVIFMRLRALKLAFNISDNFENRFWSGIELHKLYQDVSSRKSELIGTEHVFYAGFGEYNRLKGQSAESIMQGSVRAMRVALSREVEALDAHLAFLATVGSISPYIGLFGTVWGIMNSFIALGAVKQATLSMVAPGIAEALIATAMGLFAAIPAVMFYNNLTDKVSKLEHNYAMYLDEFSSILHRQAYAPIAQVVKNKAPENLASNNSSMIN